MDSEQNSISKSQKKRDMLALQAVGEELFELTAEALRKLSLPEELLEAVLEAKRIPVSKHGGIKRQLQYIGRLMREIDAAPIIAQLQAANAPNQKQTALHHLAERWRDRMMSDATSVAAFANEFPGADALVLDRFIAAAREDHANGRPPKNFRLLYQTLHKHIVERARLAAAPEQE
jgi:ribosome-associated protein